ncbi:MAG TPA: hypothetical protein VEJ63_02935 [Planctomycetota bacterium]|nr:hypothetical protein [Planctomycetota bacterium]
MLRLFVLLSFAIGLSAYSADEIAQPSEAQVAQWIRELSAEDFDTRDVAREKLEHAGVKALPILRDHLKSAGVDEKVALENVIYLIRVKEFKRHLPRLKERTSKHLASLNEELDNHNVETKKQIDSLWDSINAADKRIQKLERDLAVNPKAGDVIEEEILELKEQVERQKREVKTTKQDSISKWTELKARIKEAQASLSDIAALLRDGGIPPALLDSVDPSKLERWSMDVVSMDLRLSMMVRFEFVDTPIDEGLRFLKQVKHLDLTWEKIEGRVCTLNTGAGMTLRQALEEIARQGNATLTIDTTHRTMKIIGRTEEEEKVED